MLHELWREPAGEEGGPEANTFFPVGPHVKESRAQLPPNAELVWTVDASSWREAMTLYHEYMGWEPYKPVDGLSEETYADLGWE